MTSSSSALTAVQVRSSVHLMPQSQLSGRGPLPSPTTWSPDQHHMAMLAVSANFGQDWRMWSWVWSACLHSYREVSEMPVLFRWAFRPQCPVHRQKTVVCWAHSCLQIGSRCAWYPLCTNDSLGYQTFYQ